MQSLEAAQPSNGDSAGKQVTFCAPCEWGSCGRVALNVEADGSPNLLSSMQGRQTTPWKPWRMTALPQAACLSQIAQVGAQSGDNADP